MKNLIGFIFCTLIAAGSVCCEDPSENELRFGLDTRDGRVEFYGDRLHARVGLGAEGGTVSFTVVSNSAWRAVSDAESWCMVSQAGEKLAIIADEYTGYDEERTAKVTVTDESGLSAEIVVTQTSQEPVALRLTGSGHIIPPQGGSVSITVEADEDIRWELEDTGFPWIRAEYDRAASVITLRAERNITDMSLTATLRVTAGEGIRKAVAEWAVEQPSSAMILEYTVYEAATVAAVPLWGEVDCTVDWGDGTPQEQLKTTVNAEENYPKHWYAAPGIYRVSISGSAEGIRSGAAGAVTESMSAVLQWGDLHLESLERAFEGTRIKTIPLPGTENVFADVTSAADAFSGCTSLESVPDGLFLGLGNAVTFARTFSGCTALTNVPAGLFDNCTLAVDFTEIFDGCTSLQGESPYSTVNGQKVYLYQRKDYGEPFAAPEATAGAFRGCENLSDYPNIPESWK